MPTVCLLPEAQTITVDGEAITVERLNPPGALATVHNSTRKSLVYPPQAELDCQLEVWKFNRDEEEAKLQFAKIRAQYHKEAARLTHQEYLLEVQYNSKLRRENCFIQQDCQRRRITEKQMLAQLKEADRAATEKLLELKKSLRQAY